MNKVRIKIKNKIARLEFNLANFKKQFSGDLDFKQAYYNNIKLVENPKNENVKVLLKLLYLAFNWGELFRHIKAKKQNKIVFELHRVELKGFQQLVPSCMSEDKRVLELSCVDVNESVLILQDAITHPNFCIDNMLGTIIFDYGGKKYNLMMEMR